MSLRTLFRKLYSNDYLFVTNVSSGALLLVASDAIQQAVERRFLINSRIAADNDQSIATYDRKRAAKMAGCGIYFGVLGHYWYRFLDRRFPIGKPLAIRNKLLCEAALSPPFAGSLFLVAGAASGQSWPEIKGQIRDNAGYICLVDYAIFLPLQYLNFRFVPPNQRLLFVAAVGIVYDMFLSFVLNRHSTNNTITSKTDGLVAV
ncbi:mpv17-like protein 2 [Oppia nitens]|uniref:mpv17-like protein 2 n=1 Tax=Oppia nitens TaxID=1686743 RepID=UPI0023DB39FE|nr:mpv17-like protein 2 [Oppia nitens]